MNTIYINLFVRCVNRNGGILLGTPVVMVCHDLLVLTVVIVDTGYWLIVVCFVHLVHTHL